MSQDKIIVVTDHKRNETTEYANLTQVRTALEVDPDLILFFSKRTISEHINNIFETGELDENSVYRNFRTPASDNKNYNVTHYNLDVIIAVGHRVNSKQATRFRQWATSILKEYLIKGFSMDDEKLKYGGGYYYYELIERIRDIRSSEKHQWSKLLDIFKTSVDYNEDESEVGKFFAIMQNKLHYATHGHTASELIYDRIDATKPNLGMTNFTGTRPSKSEAMVAKNYLSESELYVLNRISTLYLDFAELMANEKRLMTMNDWINKLNEFIVVTDRKLLDNGGNISKYDVSEKIDTEYQHYINIDDDFIRLADKILSTK